MKKLPSSVVNEWWNQPISTVSNVISVIGSVSALVLTVLGFSGGSSTTIQLNASLNGTGFLLPISITILVLLASGIGWTFGLIVLAFTRKYSEVSAWLAYITAFCFAALLMGVVSWLSNGDTEGTIRLSHLYLLVGTAATLMLAQKKFRANPTPSKPSAATRAGAILAFSASALALGLLSELTVV